MKIDTKIRKLGWTKRDWHVAGLTDEDADRMLEAQQQNRKIADFNLLKNNEKKYC